ncbi:MAG: hypothetical protein M3O00_07905 [Pseudomonadota bacterium]|jgi:hypothetical protein|nr:hypothetical protein [Pseudomonadota bacterium]
MGGFLLNLTPADRAIIGIIVLVPLLMIFAIHSIRREVRDAGRIKAKSVKLKTSREQRRKWRQESLSKDILNLLDDVETLLKVTHADELAVRQEHREALRLSWLSYHVPVRTALLGSVLLAGVLSAIFVILAQGPSNPIP